MSLRRTMRPTLVFLFSASIVAVTASAATPELGSIHFPTSGSKEAQTHFLRGVAALHSFWYEEALAAFHQATTVEPGFAMGYWGEAMAHNHPVWAEQDIDAGRAALAKITDSIKLSKREQTYVDAVRLLYGEGEKPNRDRAYAGAMKTLHETYPEDLEGACFYALSLLGLAEHNEDAERLRLQAGAIALDVSRQNPEHPGAAHYTIHAFDDPDHAIRALPAARRYAAIAPAAPHAQHMPAHIFLQLGMWPEAASSNEAGWRDSVAWVQQKGLPAAHRDYHSLSWLHYVYLQQGRYKEARQLLKLKRTHMLAVGEKDETDGLGYGWRVGRYYEAMTAAFILETERWDLAAMVVPSPGLRPADPDQALPMFVRGLGAALRGRTAAGRYLAAMRSFRQSRGSRDSPRTGKQLKILELEVAAAIQGSKGHYDEAFALMDEATALEEALPPPSGPPRLIKPSHELYGELLLRAGRPEAAAKQFEIALQRQPNRARALLGAARAAQRLDREAAAAYYSKLLRIWAHADPNLPELREAEEYLGRKASGKM